MKLGASYLSQRGYRIPDDQIKRILSEQLVEHIMENNLIRIKERNDPLGIIYTACINIEEV